MAASTERDAGRRLDLMGEASFPASDPPATWTWDPDRTETLDDAAETAEAESSESGCEAL